MNSTAPNRLVRAVPAMAPMLLAVAAVAYVVVRAHVHEINGLQYHVTTDALVAVAIAIAAGWIPLYDSRRRQKAAEAVAQSWKAKHDLQQEVARARELYTTIVDVSRDFMWVAQADGLITLANSRGMDLCTTGRTTLQEVFGEESRGDVERALAAVMEGEPAELEVKMAVDGQARILEVSGVRLPAGGSVWSARDLTAIRRDELRIRELESHLRAMLDKAPVLAVTGSADGTIEFVNRYLAEVTGYRPEELIGRKWADVFLTPGMSGYNEWQVHANALPTAEYDIRTRSGRFRRVRWSRTHFRDWQGNVVGVGSVGEDITAREAAARALLDSEKRFRGTFEQSVLGMVLTDAGGRTVDCNAAFRKLFSLPANDMKAMAATDAVLARVPELVARLESLWAGEKSDFAVEAPFDAGEGLKWCRVTSSLLRDAMGDPSLAMTFFEDVTERRRSLAQLAESHEMYRNLVELTSDFIWRIDEQGRYTYASPQIEKILGYRPQEILGHRPMELMASDEADWLQPIIDDYMMRPRPLEMFLNANRHRDGHTVMLETCATPIFDADGTFAGYQGIDRDVTDREHGRRDLNRLATAIAAAGDAIIITDRNGVIQYVNPAFEQITGYKWEEVAGQTPRVLKSGRQSDDTYERLWRELLEGRNWSGRFVNRRKDGSLYEADVTISPIYDDGVHTGFVAVQRDMTEHMSLLERLHRAEEMERLGRLVGGVAHEVRNPLNAIQAATAALELDHGDTPGSRELFGVVTSQVDRLTKLMHDLLQLGKPLLERQPMAAADLCREALAVWRGGHAHDAGRVREELESCGDKQIHIDSVRMQQVIINLLDNAVQNSPANSEIILGCGVSGADVRIYVADNGSGIDAEVARKVFEPFFTTHRRGTGLGLSLVRNIVQRHGGQVVLRNREGARGAIAEVFLPPVTAEVEALS